MNAFRNEVIKLHKKCLITGYNEIECDAAHIIPQAICYKLNLADLANNHYNGILLNKTIHSTYDRFLWCFDIYDIQKVPGSTDWCYLKIILSSARTSLSINEYKENLYMVPINSLPFLWVNYNVFMATNFTTTRDNSNQTNNQNDDIYSELLNSEIYKVINSNPLMLLDQDFIDNISQARDIVAITGKRKFGTQYQVLYQGQKWADRQWIDNDNENMNNSTTMHLLDKDPEWQDY